MREMKCTLNPLCHIWTKMNNGKGYLGRDGCLFNVEFNNDIRAVRNADCPFPVELVYSNLVEVP